MALPSAILTIPIATMTTMITITITAHTMATTINLSEALAQMLGSIPSPVYSQT